jgi:hypothetical protein
LPSPSTSRFRSPWQDLEPVTRLHKSGHRPARHRSSSPVPQRVHASIPLHNHNSSLAPRRAPPPTHGHRRTSTRAPR